MLCLSALSRAWEEEYLSVLDVHPVLSTDKLQVQVMTFPLLSRKLLPQFCYLVLCCLIYRCLRDLGMAFHPALQLLNLPVTAVDSLVTIASSTRTVRDIAAW